MANLQLKKYRKQKTGMLIRKPSRMGLSLY